MIVHPLIVAAFALASGLSLLTLYVMSRPDSDPGRLVIYDSGVQLCLQNTCKTAEFGCSFAFCDDGTGNVLNSLPVPLRVVGPNGTLIADSSLDLVNGVMLHSLVDANVTLKASTAFGAVWTDECRNDSALSFYEARVSCAGNETVVCFCFKP